MRRTATRRWYSISFSRPGSSASARGRAGAVVDCFFQPNGEADFSSVAAAHQHIIDQVVEINETVMGHYLDDGESGLSGQELHDAFEECLRQGHLVPICFVSSRTGVAPGRNVMRKVLQTYLGRNEVPHGFRASFSTWASEKNGFNDNVIEASLAHVVGGVRGAYKRNPNGDYLLDARRELMVSWADFVVTTPPEVEAADEDKVTSIGVGR